MPGAICKIVWLKTDNNNNKCETEKQNIERTNEIHTESDEHTQNTHNSYTEKKSEEKKKTLKWILYSALYCWM